MVFTCVPCIIKDEIYMERNITTVYKGGDQLILGESDARCKVKNIICIYRYITVKFLFSWRWNRWNRIGGILLLVILKQFATKKLFSLKYLKICSGNSPGTGEGSDAPVQQTNISQWIYTLVMKRSK